MAYKNMNKLLNLKSYANKHLICIRNIAGHTAANWRVKKLNLNTISVSKWHTDKFEEQVCHNFDQFLPLNAVVKG